jgi:signal transduction histidine kinase
MSHRTQILIVEDNPLDAELLIAELQRCGFEFEWNRVDTESDYLSALDAGPDLVLSDYELPSFNGLRALQLLKESPTSDTPFILISGTIGEELAVDAMRRGATDYLLKDRIGRLGTAVQRALQGVREYRERKRLEAQFIEAQKMEVVGHLAGGVAHDFNNVLAVIMGYSDLISAESRSNATLQSYSDEIRQAARRAAGLTQQLLIFSRKETVQAVVLDPNEVIEGMGKMLHRLVDDNIELTIACRPQIGRIKVDSGYLWQVIMNMVINARDAMPDGGSLTVETNAVTLGEAYALEHPRAALGDYFVISISDTGVGMTREVKERIFEAFFTTKPAGKGTGLGLATCQTIVRQAGGHIDASSEIGKGTTFRIYFPLVGQAYASPALEKISAPPSEPARHGTETLLVVEDDPSLRHLARGILQANGYQVLTASNGHEALRVAREHRGAPIALVITDVVMPRMNGKVMAEWLKDSFPDLQILFTSGYADSIARYGVVEDEVEFLAKPYSPAELTRKVRDLLDQPHRE